MNSKEKKQRGHTCRHSSPFWTLLLLIPIGQTQQKNPKDKISCAPYWSASHAQSISLHWDKYKSSTSQRLARPRCVGPSSCTVFIQIRSHQKGGRLWSEGRALGIWSHTMWIVLQVNKGPIRVRKVTASSPHKPSEPRAM